MFPNLNAETSRKGIKKRFFAPIINVGETTVYRKLKGEIPITLAECKKIRDEYFSEFTVEFLFAEEGEHVENIYRNHHQHS